MIKITIKNNTGSYNKLSVFDFDGTLFKSPEKPKNHKGNWWIEKVSLGSETVGEVPTDDFWNLDIVNNVFKELNNKNTYCILLTGRVDNIFEDRIKQLLNQKKINFKEVHLNSFGEDTGKFKIKTINNILKKHPSIKNIEMWEDEMDKAELYTKEYSDKFNFKCNLVEG